MLTVGIVITTYNRARLLNEALTSVLSQTLLPQEIVVVDDGGSDNSEQIATSFNGVKYLWQENAGPGSARNLGAKSIESHMIAFLDDDDLWLKEKLEIQCKFLVEKNLDVAFCHGYEFMEEHPATPIAQIRTDAPFLFVSSMLVKRESFLQIGDFDERIRAGGEFIEWYARAKDAGLVIGMCDESLVKRRVHANNNSSTKSCDHTRYTTAMKQIIERRRNASQK